MNKEKRINPGRKPQPRNREYFAERKLKNEEAVNPPPAVEPVAVAAKPSGSGDSKV
jgi:hypothetical protein